MPVELLCGITGFVCVAVGYVIGMIDADRVTRKLLNKATTP